MKDYFWTNFPVDSAVIFFVKFPMKIYILPFIILIYIDVISVGFFVPILEFL